MHLGLGSLTPQPPRQLCHERPLFEWPSKPAGFQGGEYLGVLAPHKSELFKNWFMAGYEKPDVALLDLGGRDAAPGSPGRGPGGAGPRARLRRADAGGGFGAGAGAAAVAALEYTNHLALHTTMDQ